ncbi:hypothetical protein bcCo53_001368 (plasmid) [Borrelia coriaceae]|uniref:Uncharacterized protein n=1 Tax=Borrelia coriaceae ATCC 43381 TaxID=1408429 RepID=W5SXS2_9SPIR|nr:hypothetical protein [Borrelia coriaceae]AHH11959.1 hypothetical protein BCO_0018412 [Borrelia coriaceae ATCC 43381]UPA17191.1 hypothetical protein bcCo53_001368 [Borrelia coriaceae]
MLKLLLLLTVITNLSPISKKEHNKYIEKERKLVRVKDWKTNFNNLTNLSPSFTNEIEKIKSLFNLSEKDFSISCTPDDIICHPLSRNHIFRRHQDTMKEYFSFLNTLKRKNPDQAAYLIYEIYTLGTTFDHTRETIYGFNYEKPQNAIKQNPEYKKTFESLKNIYYKAQHDLDLATNILKQKYTDNNFDTFMLKFIEIHKLATHAYFNIYNLLYKCIHSQSTEEKNKYCKYN